MAVISAHSLHSPFSTTAPLLPLRSFPSPPLSKPPRISCSPSPVVGPQTDDGDGRKMFMEFPYVSAPYKDLMVDLVSTMESRLGPYLLPCTLPPDVQYYHNRTNTAFGTLHIRSGIKPSPIDFVLGSWLHCKLPSGALNITSLSAYLSPSTDAPNFLIDLIQSSPTSVVLILDMPPRKDLVLHPDYLQTFYEDTQLDKYRKLLDKIPEVRPYSSSSLYIRCFVSPTAILVCIETEPGRTEWMEEIVRHHVSVIAKEVFGVWLDHCACGGREVGETDRAHLAKRDQIFKSKSIEIDLGSSLPRLFGQEVATRVLGVIRDVFNI